MHRSVSTVGLFLLLLQSAVCAQTPAADAPDAPPRLKAAPILVPPPAKALKQGGSGSDGDAVYLRADKLDGDNEKSIEASGNVELRTRRQTVLADWLHYDLVTEEIWAKGNVLMRRGVDTISGPEARFKRTNDSGFFHQPAFHIGELASRGTASELLFVDENHYELKDMSYTTCVAGNDDWYLNAREVDLDRSRLVGTARNASIVFKGATILSSPYLDFPLSNERKSGFLTPVFGSSQKVGEV